MKIVLLIALASLLGCNSNAFKGITGASKDKQANSSDSSPDGNDPVATVEEPSTVTDVGTESTDTEATVTATEVCHIIDFEKGVDGEALKAGLEITTQFAELGVTISAENNTEGNPDKAILFDSANPTGGDDDLRTPGDGINNNEALGNLLIIAENDNICRKRDRKHSDRKHYLTDSKGDDHDDNGDGLISKPDDEAGGGIITFDFDQFVVIRFIDVIDIEEEGSLAVASSEFIDPIELEIEPLGDNSVQTIDFDIDPIIETDKLEIILTGSGAVDNLEFCLRDGFDF